MTHQDRGRTAEWVAALLGTVAIGRVLAFPFADRTLNLTVLGVGCLLWSVKLLGRLTAGKLWTRVLTRRRP